jgi:hypothetical protein
MTYAQRNLVGVSLENSCKKLHIVGLSIYVSN